MLLRVTWENTAPVEQRLRAVRPAAITVSKDGGEERRWRLFESVFDQAADTATASIGIPPGRSYSRSFWIGLGDPRGGVHWEFLFAEPGRYTLSLPDDPKATTDVDVVAPARAEDRAAGMEFTPPVAALVLGERPGQDSKQDLDPLGRICRDFPGSTYAPYAALVLARHLWRSRQSDRTKFDLDRYRACLDLIIEKHPQTPVREAAFYWMVKGYAFQADGREDAWRWTGWLAKERPQSEYLKVIERAFGLRPDRPSQERKPKVVKVKGTVKLDAVALDKVPEGPRQVIESFWRAEAAERFDEAMKFLAADFTSDVGDRSRLLDRWQQGAALYNRLSVTCEVESAEYAYSYTRPPGLPAGREKAWEGELVIVRCRTLSKSVDLRTGEERTSRSAPSVVVLKKIEDDWRLVSQHSESRNLKAALLAQRADVALRTSFGDFALPSADGQVVICEELRNHLAKGVDGPTLSWSQRGLTMSGEDHDSPVIDGEVAVSGTGADGKPVTARYLVTITLALEGDRLRLASIQEAPLMPAEPPPSEWVAPPPDLD